MNAFSTATRKPAASGFTPVSSSVLQRKCACGKDASGSKCEECRKKGALQRMAKGAGISSAVPPIVHDVLRTPGQPLERNIRSHFETRFGRDFSGVRVHADARAAESADAVNAQAYTVGRDIVFNRGFYAPGTAHGRNLLAHELTHTVQQNLASPSSQLTIDNNPELERQADSAVSGDAASIDAVAGRTGGGVLARTIVTDDGPVTGAKDNPPSDKPNKKPKAAPAAQTAKCDQMPGGSTDCEIDPQTGTPTGKVTHEVTDTNPCSRPCVEKHEAVHVKQLKTFCPQLRDCYLDADKGRRDPSDCIKMAIFGTKERECAAYKVSVPCMENQIKNSPACQSETNKKYAARKLASEKCFRDANCG